MAPNSDNVFDRSDSASWRSEVAYLEEMMDAELLQGDDMDMGELRARLSWAKANANLYAHPTSPLTDASDEALRLAYLETSRARDDDEANAILAEMERRALRP